MNKYIIATTVFALVVHAGAYACVCVGLPGDISTVEAHLQKSDFAGIIRVDEKVTRSWIEGDADKFDSYVQATVIEAFKGLPEDSNLFIDLTDNDGCRADFHVRDSYVVFASGPHPDGRYRTSICSIRQYESAAEGSELHNQQLQYILGPMIQILREATQE